MDDESDEQIKKRLFNRFSALLGDQATDKHLFVIDEPGDFGRPVADWHDEIVVEIDAIRQEFGLSAEIAAKRIQGPYLVKFNVSEESFLDAYWKRKSARKEEQFLRALSSKDIDQLVEVYRTLTRQQRDKYGLN